MNPSDIKHPGRPRQFDTNEVLRIVQDLFWQKGYKETSLSDLIDATGLHKGSLYKAFGDKKQLYLLALENYMNDTFNETVSIASQFNSPLAALSSILFHIVDDTENNTGCARGCMVINSIIQSSEEDPELQALIKNSYEKRFNALVKLIEEGQKVNEIHNSKPAELLAAITMTFTAGLSTAAKSQHYMDNEEPINSKDQVDTFINLMLKA